MDRSLEYHVCSSPVRLVIPPACQTLLDGYEREILNDTFPDPRAMYCDLVAPHVRDTVRVLPCKKGELRWIDISLFGNVKPADEFFWQKYKIRFGIFREHDGPRLIMMLAGVKSQGKGIFAHALARQVQSAYALGFTSIEATGVRKELPGLGDGVGYYAAPRLGFDCELSATDRSQLPADLAGATRLLDLLETSSGRKWWRENGWQVTMDFDTTPISRSMGMLRQYFLEKGWDWPSDSSPIPKIAIATDIQTMLPGEETCTCEQLKPRR